MRIVVVSAPRQRGVPEYVKSLARGMESMGHRVDILDAWTEDGMRLPGYEYIVVVAEPNSFFSGKIPLVVSKILAAGSALAGKKSAAFIKKSGLFTNRAVTNLLKAMEKEGLFVNWSDILFDSSHAEAIGKRIGA